jgi:multidrug efflux system membrane fusion protein
VVPNKTVMVKSRVDGQLMDIAFHEGQEVRAGDFLAQVDPRPFQVQLEQAAGQLAKDHALLRNAELDLQRYRNLIAEDSIARQQLDTQEALVRQYEATIRVDQSQVDNAKLQLTYARITAPVSGRLGLRLVDLGNIVHANDANGLVVITQVHPITVVFTLPEDQLPQVLKRVRAKDTLTVEAYDREQKNKLAGGTLLSVDNLIDPTTGTVKLKALFDNEDGLLFPNQFVNARMQLDVKRDVTLIPTAALQRGAQGPFVYVVSADQTAAMRPITVGTVQGDTAAVDSGVQPGELVVVDGADKLRDGVKVEQQSREGGPAGAGEHGQHRKGRP